jgi:hypothetical protein
VQRIGPGRSALLGGFFFSLLFLSPFLTIATAAEPELCPARLAVDNVPRTSAIERSAIERALTAPGGEAPKRRHIVLVEGAGDVAKRFYGPAYAAVRERYQGSLDFQMFCADSSEYWYNPKKSKEENDAYANRMLATWEALRGMGITILDKAKPEQLAQYKALEADTLIVANIAKAHVKTALAALDRPYKPSRIFIEKPLDSDLDAGMDLLGRLTPYDNHVWAYDHYRARVTFSKTQLGIIKDFLDHHIVESNFYFLEDRSGSDPTLPKSADRSAGGAFEIENRLAVGDDGVILDQMSHKFPLLRDFGNLETTRPVKIKAARYMGIRGEPTRPTDVKGETFAAFEFAWHDHKGHLAKGHAYVGKGVRGVKALGPEYDYNAKLFELVAKNGNRLRVDLRSSGQGASTAKLIDASGRVEAEMPVNANPYEVFLDLIADQLKEASQVAINVEEAFATLRLLDIVRRQLARYPERVGLLPGGMAPCPALPDGRPALYLEEYLNALAPIIGSDEGESR